MSSINNRSLRPADIKDNLDATAQVAKDTYSSAESQARKLTDNAVEELSALASNLNTRLKDLGIDTEKAVEGAKEGAASLERKISDELVSHPLRSLAIAAGIGLAFGILTRK